MNQLTHDQAVKMNLILAILINYNQQYRGAFIGPDQLYKQLKISRDETVHLLHGIIGGLTHEGAPVVKSKPNRGSLGPKIGLNFNTEKFLQEDGYLKYFNEQEQIQKQADRKEELAVKNLENNIEMHPITQKHYTFIIIAAIVGWAFFFIQLFLQLKGII